MTAKEFIYEKHMFDKITTVDEWAEMMDEYASQPRPMNKIVVDDKSTYPPIDVKILLKYLDENNQVEYSAEYWQCDDTIYDEATCKNIFYHYYGNNKKVLAWSYLPE